MLRRKFVPQLMSLIVLECIHIMPCCVGSTEEGVMPEAAIQVVDKNVVESHMVGITIRKVEIDREGSVYLSVAGEEEEV